MKKINIAPNSRDELLVDVDDIAAVSFFDENAIQMLQNKIIIKSRSNSFSHELSLKEGYSLERLVKQLSGAGLNLACWPERRTGDEDFPALSSLIYVNPTAILYLSISEQLEVGEPKKNYHAAHVGIEGLYTRDSLLSPEEAKAFEDRFIKGRSDLVLLDANCIEGMTNETGHTIFDPARLSRVYADVNQAHIEFDPNNAKTFNFSTTPPVMAAQDLMSEDDEIKKIAEEEGLKEAWKKALDKACKNHDKQSKEHALLKKQFIVRIAAMSPHLKELENSQFGYFTRTDIIQEARQFPESRDCINLQHTEDYYSGGHYHFSVDVYFQTEQDAVNALETIRKHNPNVPQTSEPPRLIVRSPS